MDEEDGFKVTLESLYSKKIKEISYDEEETYQEKPTLSQKLTELAQRVDFSDKVGDEGSEPASKKAAQRWPWEVANSKLRQALTEISVLSDVIQIAQHQQKYVALDPVMAAPSGSASPAYQYFIKKKALGLAAEILLKGTKSLSLSSTEKEREFHKALAALRQRWRLKRVGSGAIIGDLSYHSAGSAYSGTVSFDLTKYRPDAGSSTSAADSATDMVSVTIPRELRGRSEVLVFLSPEPVQEIPPLSSFPPPLTVKQLSAQRGATSSADLQLITAQNMLFNQELFAHLAREAYDKKPLLQHEVFTNRINVPLSLDCWVSVLHVREYDQSPPPVSASSSSSSSPFPPPRWDLVVALKQLLRETHRKRTTLVTPRPSTAGFLEQPEVRNAGVVPLKLQDLKQLETTTNIFNQFMNKAEHVYNEERLYQWLGELCLATSDPSLRVVWKPDHSFTLATADLVVTDSLASPQSPRCCVRVVLKVGEVTVTRAEECGGDITFPLQRDKLFRILKHQVVFQRMKLARKLAEDRKWRVMQELPHPLQSCALGRLQSEHPQTTSLLLESDSASQRKVEVVFQWEGLSISVSGLKPASSKEGEEQGEGGVVSVDQWETKSVATKDMSGSNIREKFISVLTNLTS